MATSLISKVGFAVLCALPSWAWAQETLPDPTRPALALDTPVSAVATVREVLQSVIISSSHKAAIISGQTVALGENFGDSRLLEVNEGSVVLQNAEGKRVLALYPSVTIKPRQMAKKAELKNIAPVHKVAHKAAKKAATKERK